MAKRRMIVRSFLFVALATALGTTAFTFAQNPPAAPQDQTKQPEPDSSDVPLFSGGVTNILVPVTVVDKDTDKFVNGLTPLDFDLYDNGKKQRITEDIATHPISLVVAIQANSGMEQILPQIRKIGSLLSTLVAGESGEIAVIAFDHRIQHMTDFTADPDKIDQAIKKIKPGSTSSRLDDAAMEATNMLKHTKGDRKRIALLISEARDYGSEIKVREVLTEMEFANVTTYTVNVSHLISSLTSKAQPPRPNPVPIEGRRQPDGSMATFGSDASTNFGNWTPVFKEIFTQVKGIFIKNPLEVYTQYTGGREYSFIRQKALEQAIADIGEELHSQYLLSYSPDESTRKEGGWHDIKVIVKKPNYEIRTRDGYWMAAKFN